jgi:hypothetical protein
MRKKPVIDQEVHVMHGVSFNRKRNSVDMINKLSVLLIALIMVCSTANAWDTKLPGKSRDDVRVISDADLTQVLERVLTHKTIAVYLHPEVPGRLPVMIAIGKPYSYQPIQFNLYDQPVVITTEPKNLKIAVKLKPVCSLTLCKVEVDYKPEGIFGQVELKKDSTGWKVTDSKLYE